MFLFGDGNKGFWLYREWPPIVERVKGEIIRLKSKISTSIIKLSSINNLKATSKIQTIIKRASKLALDNIKLKSVMKELQQLTSKINSKVSLNTSITVSKFKQSTINVIKTMKSGITKIIYIFTKIKKDEH